jgi:hypothetical protein
MRTVAVIPNWNGAGRLSRCLASVRAQRGAEYEVVVVDNASTDGSDRAAAAMGARVICLAENRGFAAAVNRGIAESESEFVAAVNNDVVLHPDWLATLARALDSHPDCGMASGRVFMANQPGVLDGAGDGLCLGLAAARLGHGLPDGPAYQQEREVLAVSGTAALFRRRVFARVGGFEEAFFAYLEDVELCLRAQLAGFRARYIPEALAWHQGSASTGGGGRLDARVAAWLTAHQLLLAARYARGRALRPLLGRIVTVQLLWAGRLLRRGRPLAWLRGLRIAARQWQHVSKKPLPPAASPERLLELLRASEAQIFADRVPHDPFWRLYFRLFHCPEKVASGEW